MKKFIIFVISIFLISGCQAEYTLLINDEEYSDSLFLFNSQSYLLDKLKYEDNSMDVVVAEIRSKKSNYEEEFVTESVDRTGYLYSSQGDISNLAKNSIVTLFYDNVDVNIEDEILTLKTSSFIDFDQYGAPLDDVSIVIKSNRELIDTNAHEVNDNTYKWHFMSGDLEEATDHTIYLQLGGIKKNYSLIILFIILIVGVVLAFIYYIHVVIQRRKI